jgi:hypothetical protein
MEQAKAAYFSFGDKDIFKQSSTDVSIDQSVCCFPFLHIFINK